MMVSLWLPDLGTSLFWSYLMGIFPVSHVVKVVPVLSGTAFPCYLSGYFCDTRGAFLCLVSKVYAEHWLCALPRQPLGRRDVSCHMCKASPDHADSNCVLL